VGGIFGTSTWHASNRFTIHQAAAERPRRERCPLSGQRVKSHDSAAFAGDGMQPTGAPAAHQHLLWAMRLNESKWLIRHKSFQRAETTGNLSEAA